MQNYRDGQIMQILNKLMKNAMHCLKWIEVVDFWSFLMKETLSSAGVVHSMSLCMTLNLSIKTAQ